MSTPSVDFFIKIMYGTSIMATEKPRILITVDEKLLKQIDDFRYENRIPTRSEAIRQLVKEALKKHQKAKKTT